VSDILRCTECHSDVGHGFVSAGRVIVMDSCMGCHDGAEASQECSSCHVGERERTDVSSAWAQVHSTNWASTHGMGELETCAVCHPAEDCSTCHMQMPHGPVWTNLHGQTAIDVGDDTCVECHVESLCVGCHGLEMPHPQDFLPIHADKVIAVGSDDVCLACHALNDCDDCHATHSHPGLNADDLMRLDADE